MVPNGEATRLLRALDDERLARNQRGKVLVSDLARQQQNQNVRMPRPKGAARPPFGLSRDVTIDLLTPTPNRRNAYSRRHKAPVWRKCDRFSLLMD